MTVVLITLLSLLAGLAAAFVLRGRADGRLALAAGLAALIGNVLLAGFC